MGYGARLQCVRGLGQLSLRVRASEEELILENLSAKFKVTIKFSVKGSKGTYAFWDHLLI